MSQRGTSKDRTVGARDKGDADALADDRPRKGIPPVGPKARSRRYIDNRLASASDYGAFAAAAGADIFDGEPIERFGAVGKIDERFLRFRAEELREAIFGAEQQERGKRLTG